MAETLHEDHGLFHVHASGDKLKTAFWVTIAVLALEVIGGLLSNSLALLSDAGHVLTDLAAIGFSWYSVLQGKRPPTASMTFGYQRMGILAALVNAAALIGMTLLIVWEAMGRFHSPVTIDSRWMFITSGLGLLINLWLGLGMREASHDMNVRAAMLHILGDAAASAGVLVGGLLIGWTDWTVIDPLISIMIALLIGTGAWNILRGALTILMDASPPDVNMNQLIQTILTAEGILEIHDLHVWSLSSHQNALSCHVVIDGRRTVEECQTVLRNLEHELLHLGVGHTTIQIEDPGNPHRPQLFCIGTSPVHHPAHRHSH
ncbi:MAG: cation diffusion facilitator family transporter [Bacilli bacterium]|nr:cation diffusion facilitator family transporter [Bacilli bacterium]